MKGKHQKSRAIALYNFLEGKCMLDRKVKEIINQKVLSSAFVKTFMPWRLKKSIAMPASGEGG